MHEQEFLINGAWHPFGNASSPKLPNGVILGQRWLKNGEPILTAMLPDRFVGEGNDMAFAVLRVLISRLWDQHPKSKTRSMIEFIRNLDQNRYD